MSFDAWLVFALFWVVFVTTPGPNAVNCISNGMNLGFARAMVGVLAILTQALLFLALSAIGVTALLTASATGFFVAKMIGAGFLIYLGALNWLGTHTVVQIVYSVAVMRIPGNAAVKVDVLWVVLSLWIGLKSMEPQQM